MNFFELCKIIGNNYSWVQGTGGNISVKISENEMLIKASGIAISEITEIKGLVRVNFQKLIKFYSSSELNFVLDNGNQTIMQSKIEKNEIRPSMETGFHSFLGKYVVHTHPSSLLLFLSTLQGKKILTILLKNYNIYWLNYVTPGHELSYEVGKLILDCDINQNIVIFLQNHGLIISTDSIKRNIEINIEINHILDEFILTKGIPKFKKDKLVKTNNGYISQNKIIQKYMQKFNNNEFCFPDAVVFGNKIFNHKSHNMELIDNNQISYYGNESYIEKINTVLNLHMYILLNVEKIGTPKFLSKKNIECLLNMDEEKYRQRQIE